MIYQNLLVTGCGGDIGLTLGTIALETGAANRVVGCDMNTNHPGSAVFDACETIPRADSPDFPAALARLADKHRIDAIVPTSEAEITRLAAEGALESFHGRDVITANRKAVEAGLDKFNTYRMLTEAGLPAPWTVIVGEGEPKSFPCIFKPRRGQGGKGLKRVEQKDASTVAAGHKDFVWQELILPDEPEYTCGLYCTKHGEVRTIIFSRRLQGDITRTAEVVEHAGIDVLLRKIARAADLCGSINVQLRVDREGPKVFEINPRFSSTVGFRHRLGFRDFIWSLEERRGLAIEDFAPAQIGTRVYRGTSLFVIRP
jgi:carbamoyl-phosphate synthase large subunit